MDAHHRDTIVASNTSSGVTDEWGQGGEPPHPGKIN